MNDLIYNGKSLNSMGFAIRHKPFYKPATRNISINSMYGHSGAFLHDNGYYDNVSVTYGINNIPYLTHLEPQELAYSIIDWLSVCDGEYKVLRDSYNQGYFTKAICTNLSQIDVNLRRYLSTDIEFNRIPFWYSDTGQQIHTLNTNSEIINPEKISSNPYIRVYVRTIGVPISFCINGITYAFDNGSPFPYFNIDSENMSVYYENTAFDEYATFDYFPILNPGKNTITMHASIEKLEIIPRWRRL